MTNILINDIFENIFCMLLIFCQNRKPESIESYGNEFEIKGKIWIGFEIDSVLNTYLFLGI